MKNATNANVWIQECLVAPESFVVQECQYLLSIQGDAKIALEEPGWKELHGTRMEECAPAELDLYSVNLCWLYQKLKTRVAAPVLVVSTFLVQT